MSTTDLKYPTNYKILFNKPKNFKMIKNSLRLEIILAEHWTMHLFKSPFFRLFCVLRVTDAENSRLEPS